MSVTLNGKPPRRQLGDQLDRLDGIIDVLADAIPGAVADATREGARQAVREVVAELLASPELRALIAEVTRRETLVPAPAPASANSPAKPSLWDRIKEKFAAARESAADRCRSAKATASAAVGVASALMPLRKVLLLGAGVGVLVAAACYACPPAVAAAAAGACGAAAAVAAQAGRWLWRSAALLGMTGN